MCQELKPLKLIIISFLLIFSPLQVLAVDFLDIIVNEIAWMGVEVEGVESKNWWRYEWLELTIILINQFLWTDGRLNFTEPLSTGAWN